MGGTSRWVADDWDKYATTTRTKTTDKIFTSRKMHADLDPKTINIRESRDSDINPESTPIITAVDVTGSMGMIATYFVQHGLGNFFTEILNRKPITDPHLMVMGIGDVNYDDAPLQVSQFECDLTIADQLEKIYVEHGGGNNNSESYDLAAYFAAYHTSIDSFEKRGKKGYLFTIGDEMPPSGTSKILLEQFTVDTPQTDADFKTTLEAAEKMYNVYHIIIAEGNYAKTYLDKVKAAWTELLGQNAVVLKDYTTLSELMVSLIEINEGRAVDDVIGSWSGTTAIAISSAVKDLTTKPTSSSTDVILFD